MSDNNTTQPQVTRYECDDLAHLCESSVGGLVDYDDYLAIVAERDAAAKDAEEFEKSSLAYHRTTGEWKARYDAAVRNDSAILAAYDGIRARLAAAERVVNDAMCDRIIDGLDDVARDVDEYVFGLPMHCDRTKMYQVIRSALATPTTTEDA